MKSLTRIRYFSIVICRCPAVVVIQAVNRLSPSSSSNRRKRVASGPHSHRSVLGILWIRFPSASEFKARTSFRSLTPVPSPGNATETGCTALYERLLVLSLSNPTCGLSGVTVCILKLSSASLAKWDRGMTMPMSCKLPLSRIHCR